MKICPPIIVTSVLLAASACAPASTGILNETHKTPNEIFAEYGALLQGDPDFGQFQQLFSESRNSDLEYMIESRLEAYWNDASRSEIENSMIAAAAKQAKCYEYDLLSEEYADQEATLMFEATGVCSQEENLGDGTLEVKFRESGTWHIHEMILWPKK